MRHLKRKRRDIFINAVFFVLGFSTIFALLGILLQTVLAEVGSSVQVWLSRIGGLVIIFFGLYLVGLIKINFFGTRPHNCRKKEIPILASQTSFVFGMAFAVGWTPCAGAVLGSILGLPHRHLFRHSFLLFSYALGLGLPFLVVGAFTAQASALIGKLGEGFVWVNRVFGVLLIALGILVFTNNLTLLGNVSAINNLLLR